MLSRVLRLWERRTDFGGPTINMQWGDNNASVRAVVYIA